MQVVQACAGPVDVLALALLGEVVEAAGGDFCFEFYKVDLDQPL